MWFLLVFLGFYSGFGSLDHQNHCKNQEKQRKLYFEREFENCVFSGFLGFYSGFGGLLWFLLVFLGFYSGFELLTTGTAVNTKNHHEF